MNNTDIFSGKAENYAKYRPRYSQLAIEYLILNNLISKDSIVADIGSGTGIFASQILSLVSHVYCVEPNIEMQGKASSFLSNFDNFDLITATAETTTLPEKSIDTIVVAQAFHWFNPILFKDECLKILKNRGPIILIWNKKTPCVMETDRRIIVDDFDDVEDYYNYSWKKREDGIFSFFNNSVNYSEFDHPLIENWDSFIGRTFSSSHAISYSSPRFDEYIDRWRVFFDKYSQNGLLITKNKTVLYWGYL